MHKDEVVTIFRQGHKHFLGVLKKLTNEQKLSVEVVGYWTVKEVVAHLSAWNWVQIEEIDNVLAGNATWRKRFVTKKDEDEFNAAAVRERKDKGLEILLAELEDSLCQLISRVESLTEGQWRLKGMKDLFEYEDAGTSDEWKHAEEIRKFFSL